MTTFSYTAGAELPDIALTWKDANGDLIDFSAGWTFSFRLGTTPTLVKTAGITGAATAPNVTVSFAAGELDTIPAGVYAGQLWATRVSDGKDREPFPFTFHVRPPIT